MEAVVRPGWLFLSISPFVVVVAAVPVVVSVLDLVNQRER